MRVDTRPADIGRLVDDAILLYRANLRPIAWSALTMLLPAVLVAGIAGGMYYGFVLETIFMDTGIVQTSGMADTPLGFLSLIASQVLLYAAVPLRFVARVILGSSVFTATPEFAAERPVTLGPFIKAGLRRSLHLGVVEFAIGTLSQLVILAVAIIAVAILVPLAIVAVGTGLPGAVAYVMVVAMLVIAAVVFWMLALSPFAAWGPVVVIERDARLGAAASRSFALTSGRRWRTVGFWMTVLMISYAFRAALYAPATVLLTRWALPLVQEPGAFSGSVPLWITIILGVSGGIAETLVYPFERLCWSRYYLDLRARAEGMDLLVRTRELLGRA